MPLCLGQDRDFPHLQPNNAPPCWEVSVPEVCTAPVHGQGFDSDLQNVPLRLCSA